MRKKSWPSTPLMSYWFIHVPLNLLCFDAAHDLNCLKNGKNFQSSCVCISVLNIGHSKAKTATPTGGRKINTCYQNTVSAAFTSWESSAQRQPGKKSWCHTWSSPTELHRRRNKNCFEMDWLEHHTGSILISVMLQWVFLPVMVNNYLINKKVERGQRCSRAPLILSRQQ